jgi:8-oxo-dGTP pyrophosphatase MutT (NUDIX family)
LADRLHVGNDVVMWTSLEALRSRLAGPLPGLDAQLRMAPRLSTGVVPGPAPENLRPAAAIVLIYPRDGSWHIPLTVRGLTLRHHTGQVSLPGGRIDHGESVEAAALREAHEEVGVNPANVEVLGRLTPLVIDVSGHLLHPVVGRTLERPSFQIATGEVHRLIEARVSHLLRPDAVKSERRRRSRPPREMMDAPYFEVDDAHVWGATAMVLAEFLALLADLDVS